MDSVKKDIQAWNSANTDEFYKIADEIWENPELPMQEFRASGLLTDSLQRHGFTVEKGVAGMPTAFIATWGSGKPVLGINCEYDALPGLSQRKDKPTKAPIVPGAPGQGCGHNLLGTASVKAAVALKTAMEKHGLKGTVKVFGAVAEELCLGKPFLGKAGLLKGVDAWLDWHPLSHNRADYDVCNAYFNVKFHYTGKTCHGNSPWHGRSALDAAMLQATATEYLREHIYPGEPPDSANTFNYTFSDTGPEFPSVVPDRATIWYVGRFLTTKDAQDALRRIENCAKGAAIATETEVKMELITATNHKIPNKALAEAMHKNFVEIGPPVFTPEEQAQAKAIQKEMGAPETGIMTDIRPFGGGFSGLCDTSEYSWNAPYVTVWVAMAPQDAGWHNWGVNYCAAGSIGKKALDKGADLIALTGADILQDPALLARAAAEWKERLGGETYKCLLPKELEPPIHLNEDTMAKYRKGA